MKKNNIVFIVFGVFIITISSLSLFPSIINYYWKKTSATIIEVNIKTNPVNTKYKGTLIGVEATIRYEYYVNNIKYLGLDIINKNVEYTREIIYKNSDSIEIAYNPKNVSISRISKPINGTIIMMFLLGILITFIPLIYKTKRNRTIAST